MSSSLDSLIRFLLLIHFLDSPLELNKCLCFWFTDGSLLNFSNSSCSFPSSFSTGSYKVIFSPLTLLWLCCLANTLRVREEGGAIEEEELTDCQTICTSLLFVRFAGWEGKVSEGIVDREKEAKYHCILFSQKHTKWVCVRERRGISGWTLSLEGETETDVSAWTQEGKKTGGYFFFSLSLLFPPSTKSAERNILVLLHLRTEQEEEGERN